MRRWQLDRHLKEAAFQQAPMRLYLTEDFCDAALASKKGCRPGGFQQRVEQQPGYRMLTDGTGNP
jgi:hypothetical protein